MSALDQRIDKILEGVYACGAQAGDNSTENEDAPMYPSEAKAAINRLLIESKIEELETWAKEAIDSKPTVYDFEDRLAELKAQLGEEKCSRRTKMKRKAIDVLVDAMRSAYWHGELGNKNGVLAKERTEALAALRDDLLAALPERKEPAKRVYRTDGKHDPIYARGDQSFNQAIDQMERAIREYCGEDV